MINDLVITKRVKMTTEIELKYLLSENREENNTIIDDITTMLKAQNISFEMNQYQLGNDYFDTESLALRNMDFGLRIRTKNQRYEQTIKTAGNVVGCLHQRPEYNVDIKTKQLNLSLFPKNIWPENTEIETLEKKLQVIFSTDFHRQTWLIHQDESVIELALDKGKIFTVFTEVSQPINELEIELVSGDEKSLFVLASKLGAVVTMTPGKLSKAARGYTLYKNQKNKSQKNSNE